MNLLLERPPRRRRIVRNRLNDLSSRTWLQFQKSWFRDHSNVHRDFVEFFTKRIRSDGSPSTVLTAYDDQDVASAVHAAGRQVVSWKSQEEIQAPVDYALIDLRGRFSSLSDLEVFQADTDSFWEMLPQLLQHRGYLTLLIDNRQDCGQLIPIAWHFGHYLSRILTLKDEKIGCLEPREKTAEQPFFYTDSNVYYALNFRREEVPEKDNAMPAIGRWPDRKVIPTVPKLAFPSWFVPRPPPREKNVLLHPAKYPETMIVNFITWLTDPGDLVLDPMVGTGSTLLACLQSERRGVGVELKAKYARTAQERINRISGQLPLFGNRFDGSEQRVIQGDASQLSELNGIPDGIAYCITSPPYWDMLNMRGAMTQKNRRERGLDVSYSADPRDAGNIADYDAFLSFLLNVYRQVGEKLKRGGHLTIIVKNVKKGGQCFPLAWDLANGLALEYQVCPEAFWCQDDVKLAPYGYGNAWVSNTVHHYCLTFQKT